MKNLLKKEKGITLVALIITVIVMLILAGVAISALTADGGLFSKTQSAVKKYNNAVKLQDEKIATLTNEMNKYFNKYSNGEGSGDEGEEIPKDTTAPSVASIEANNIEETTFILTATGIDEESGIQKYEFYINGTLENTVTASAETAIYNVIGKVAGTTYKCKVRVYDNAGNYKDSSEISVTTKTAVNPIATTVKVGDYVNYDAGTWNEADMTKITSSAGSPTVNMSTSKPTSQGQFGGFTVGQSRNTNSTPYSTSDTPRTSGWRVWDIDNSTGIVTIISAGHPETYYHASGFSTASVNILRNRDCSMYVNKYATSAHILTGQEAATWYNKQFGTNYTITENGGSSSTFFGRTFATAEPISVLENGSYYLLASAYGAGDLYLVDPNNRHVGNGLDNAFGVRFLVSLQSDVLLETGSGDGSVANPWRIVEN